MNRQIGFYLIRVISSHQLPSRPCILAPCCAIWVGDNRVRPGERWKTLVAPLGIPHDENKQTSDGRALNPPSDDPALRDQ
jgi:hypothetical protein